MVIFLYGIQSIKLENLPDRWKDIKITCTLEKLVFKDKQVSSEIKGY
jgi:hypothetical protein